MSYQEHSMSYNKDVIGHIHSIYTGSTFDGPGIRYVLFLQGCMFRCKYCHNPDTWQLKKGIEKTVDETLDDIKKYQYFLKNGGVTISGGEPLLQIDFLNSLFAELKKNNIHTALDTNGFFGSRLIDKMLENIDLVLLDIKSFSEEKHKNLTNFSLNPIIEFANRLQKIKKRTWIRYVLVPNLTDDITEIKELSKFIKTLDNVEKVDVLPFHKMGEFKWKELGLNYELYNVNAPDKEKIEEVKSIFNS